MQNLPRLRATRCRRCRSRRAFRPPISPTAAPSVFAYGRTQADADAAADSIAALIASHESDFDGRIFTPDEGVRFAMEAAKRASKPIVIADTQDNPGAGGDSDTTGMLRALVRNGATSAAIGVIVDPESAEAAHAAGPGAIVRLALGGKSGIPGDAPFEHNFVVEKLSDGKFVGARSLLRRQHDEHRPVRLPAHRRRQGRRRIAQGATRRSGDVPLCRH